MRPALIVFTPHVACGPGCNDGDVVNSLPLTKFDSGSRALYTCDSRKPETSSHVEIASAQQICRNPDPNKGRYLNPDAFRRKDFDQAVITAVEQGVALGFADVTVPSVALRNYFSVHEHIDAVCKELDRLEALGVIEQVPNKPWVVNPLGVQFRKPGQPESA